MDAEEYLKDRLDEQMNWYDKKSMWHQKRFKRLRFIEVIAAAIIPLVAGNITSQTLELKVLVGILGVIITIIAGAVALNKYQEHWIEYRTTAESLKHQKFLFLTKTAPYHTDEAFNFLVETVEGLISKENSKWVRQAKTQGQKLQG